MLLCSSGIGKRTLLKIIGGFESLDTGQILLENKEILAPKKMFYDISRL